MKKLIKNLLSGRVNKRAFENVYKPKREPFTILPKVKDGEPLGVLIMKTIYP
jgi:hypothetical protein